MRASPRRPCSPRCRSLRRAWHGIEQLTSPVAAAHGTGDVEALAAAADAAYGVDDGELPRLVVGPAAATLTAQG